MANDPEIPSLRDLMWPTLRAVKSLGGSARIDEIAEDVIE